MRAFSKFRDFQNFRSQSLVSVLIKPTECLTKTGDLVFDFEKCSIVLHLEPHFVRVYAPDVHLKPMGVVQMLLSFWFSDKGLATKVTEEVLGVLELS